MARPAPLVEVMLPARSSTVEARSSAWPSGRPSVTLPSGARTTPPWSTLADISSREPKAEYGTAGSPSPMRSTRRLRVGS